MLKQLSYYKLIKSLLFLNFNNLSSHHYPKKSRYSNIDIYRYIDMIYDIDISIQPEESKQRCIIIISTPIIIIININLKHA